MGILGGKNKNLKCNCGNLRYPGVELCPQCYFSKVRYYVYKGGFTQESGYDGNDIVEYNSIEICKALSEDDALYKLSGFEIYGKNNQYSNNQYIPVYDSEHKNYQKLESGKWINGILVSFKTLEAAEKWRKENE